MNLYKPLCFFLLIVAIISCVNESIENQSEDDLNLMQFGELAEMIGEAAYLDSTITSQLLKGVYENPYLVDTDQDGKIEIIYMIDDSIRHGPEKQPLLVKIVDEDNDMHINNKGDYDSDIYIADWFGDGIIDAAVDYKDLDQDNDVDEQYLYRIHPLYNFPTVTLAKDYGDDNKLWSTTNYVYEQKLNEWDSDFNGDEYFVFYFEYTGVTLKPFFENPFAFYDYDGDHYSEEVVRFEGERNNVRINMHSIDIDNDNGSQPPNFHDYDFSISALGDVDYGDEENVRQFTIRDIVSEPVAEWSRVKTISKNADWEKAHLTWIENDNNVAFGHKLFERWEGVINHETDYFPKIGDPPSSKYNTRNEFDLDYSGRMQFYFSSVDHRIHLFGAELGYIQADYNFDNKMDMLYRMNDNDEDGYFDEWKYDYNGDGIFDQTIQQKINDTKLYQMDFHELHPVYMSSVAKALELNNTLIDLMKEKLKNWNNNFVEDKIEIYHKNELINFRQDWKIGEKIKNSVTGNRFYTDLIRDSYWNRLLNTSEFNNSSYYQSVIEYYNEGNYGKVIEILRN